jgi:hypothetical protein
MATSDTRVLNQVANISGLKYPDPTCTEGRFHSACRYGMPMRGRDLLCTVLEAAQRLEIPRQEFQFWARQTCLRPAYRGKLGPNSRRLAHFYRIEDVDLLKAFLAAIQARCDVIGFREALKGWVDQL